MLPACPTGRPRTSDPRQDCEREGSAPHTGGPEKKPRFLLQEQPGGIPRSRFKLTRRCGRQAPPLLRHSARVYVGHASSQAPPSAQTAVLIGHAFFSGPRHYPGPPHQPPASQAPPAKAHLRPPTVSFPGRLLSCTGCTSGLRERPEGRRTEAGFGRWSWDLDGAWRSAPPPATAPTQPHPEPARGGDPSPPLGARVRWREPTLARWGPHADPFPSRPALRHLLREALLCPPDFPDP